MFYSSFKWLDQRAEESNSTNTAANNEFSTRFYPVELRQAVYEVLDELSLEIPALGPELEYPSETEEESELVIEAMYPAWHV
jgi:hypothetical protein